MSGCRPKFPQTPKRASDVPVFHLPSRVKTRLVGIFAYPAGMRVRAPDLDSFLQEVHTLPRLPASLYLILLEKKGKFLVSVSFVVFRCGILCQF